MLRKPRSPLEPLVIKVTLMQDSGIRLYVGGILMKCLAVFSFEHCLCLILLCFSLLWCRDTIFVLYSLKYIWMGKKQVVFG